MPSQFFGLQIGYSGLTAYQAALNTTGNNIANTETKGYSRQVTNQTAAQALRTYTTYGMAGAGTTVTSIEQIRNTYYDIKYRSAATSVGEYNVKSEYNAQIENLFNDDGETILGFSTLYDRFFKSMEDLQNDPSETSVRTNFVSQAKALCEYFNSTSDNLRKIQTDANDQIRTVVDQINSLGAKIANINHQINIIELKGTTANELRDQRNQLVDELSQYVDVTVMEDPIYTNDMLDEDGKPIGDFAGAYKYTVIISGNQTLVEGYDYRTMELRSRDSWNKVNQSDADGLYDIYWKDTGTQYYPANTNYGGQLKSLLQIRDGNNSEYFHGRIENGDEEGTVKVITKATDEFLQDTSKCTLNPTGLLTVGATEYKYDSWEVEQDGDHLVYTFYMSPDDEQFVDYNGSSRTMEGLKTLINKINAASDPANPDYTVAAVGPQVSYQGIPYYQEQMNEWVRLFAKNFNTTEQTGEDMNGNSLAGSSAENKDPVAFFVAKDLNGATGEGYYDFTEEYNYPDTKTVDESSLAVRGRSSTSDSYYQLTASNFAVSDYILSDVTRMATTKKQGDINLSSSDVVDELEKLKDQKNFFRGCTSAEFLNCVLGDVALNAGSANSFQKNYTNIMNAVDNQRLSVSGVDNDEEALNLVKYQNAYNLSAKMIQVMTEIYDRLINQTGV